MFNGDRVSAGEDVEVLWADSGDGCTTTGMYLMPPNCALKMVKVVKFMLCIYFTTIKKKNVSKTTQEWASSTLIQKISTLEPLVNSAVFSPACQPQHAPLSFRDAKWQLLKHVSGSLGRRPRRSPERDNDIEAKPLEWSISSLTSGSPSFFPGPVSLLSTSWCSQIFQCMRKP